MNKKYIVILVLAVAGYFVWRRFGGQIKDTIGNVTA